MRNRRWVDYLLAGEDLFDSLCEDIGVTPPKVYYYTNSPVIVSDSAYKEIQEKVKAVKDAEQALITARKKLEDAKTNAVKNFLSSLSVTYYYSRSYLIFLSRQIDSYLLFQKHIFSHQV